MIITCEKCHTRFHLDDPRIYKRSLKVRCSKCDNIFIVPAAGSNGELTDGAGAKETSTEVSPVEPGTYGSGEASSGETTHSEESEKFEEPSDENLAADEEGRVEGGAGEGVSVPAGPAHAASNEGEDAETPGAETRGAGEEEKTPRTHTLQFLPAEDDFDLQTEPDENDAEPSIDEAVAEDDTSAPPESGDDDDNGNEEAAAAVENDTEAPPEAGNGDTGNEAGASAAPFDLNFSDEKGLEPAETPETEAAAGEEQAPDAAADKDFSLGFEDTYEADVNTENDEKEGDDFSIGAGAVEETPTKDFSLDLDVPPPLEEEGVDEVHPPDTEADTAAPEVPADVAEPPAPDAAAGEEEAEAREEVQQPLEGGGVEAAEEPETPEADGEDGGAGPPAGVQPVATEAAGVFGTSPPEEEVYSEPHSRRPRPFVAAVILAFLAGAALYIAGVSGVIPGLTSGGGGTVTGTKVGIEKLRGFYMANSGLGRIFVIETRLKNLTDKPQRIGGVRGKIYGSRGRVIGARVVSPGRVATAAELNHLSGKDLARLFRDTSGGTLPPGGSVPVMVVFTDIPQAVSEFAIEVMR